MLKKILINSLKAFAFGDAYGENPLNPSLWTDDTSLTLLLLDTYQNTRNNKFLFLKKLKRNFEKYFKKGTYTPFKIPYKYGKTTYKAFLRKKGLDKEFNCGNGSVMRSLPISFLFFKSSLKYRSKINHLQSSLTHSHPKVYFGCDLYVEFIHSLIIYKDKIKALNTLKNKILFLCKIYKKPYKDYFIEYKDIFSKSFYKVSQNKIKSSPYIVDTIKCVFYSIMKAKDIFECLKISSNFKGDPDTICAMSIGAFGTLQKFDDKLFKRLKNYYEIEKSYKKLKL